MRAVSPFGPVFLSYRRSDGEDLTRRLAWALRSAGVPVWHDEMDLPPGDTNERLAEALASGLSGAVLLVTPEIEQSTVIRKIELPRLLQLAQDPDFTFLVASSLSDPRDPAKVDFRAADRLLHRRWRRTLSRLKQWSLSGDQALATIARQMALRRMEAFARTGRDEIALEIQTRFPGKVEYPDAPLIVRLLPPESGHRAPSPEMWPPFGSFLAHLPQLLNTSKAGRVRVRGGAHLSAAFALGAALPAASRWGPHLSVEDQQQRLWRAGDAAAVPELAVVEEPAGPPGEPAAVHVDLLAAPPLDSFRDSVQARKPPFSRALRLSLKERRSLEPHEGGALAREIARRIREAAASAGTYQVHLFLGTPFPIAVLLGSSSTRWRSRCTSGRTASAVPAICRPSAAPPAAAAAR